MKLAKILVFFVVLMGVTTLQSQSIYLKGGLNISRPIYLNSMLNSYGSFNPGFHLGGSVQIPIRTNWFFEPGLRITTKGDRFTGEDFANDPTQPYYDPTLVANFQSFFVEIPLQFKFKYPYKSVHFTGAFGPYIGLGLFDISFTKNSRLYQNGFEFYPPNQMFDFPRMDCGVALSLGMEYKNFQFNVNYNIGAMPFNHLSSTYFPTNHTISLEVGYKLWNKK